MQKFNKKLYASFHLKAFLLLSQNYDNTKIIFCQVLFTAFCLEFVGLFLYFGSRVRNLFFVHRVYVKMLVCFGILEARFETVRRSQIRGTDTTKGEGERSWNMLDARRLPLPS